MMKKLITSSLLLCSMMFFVAGSAFAVKPPDVIDKSNGFPSGFHFNLNIHGKKLDFKCPTFYSGDDYNGENHQGDYGKYEDDGSGNMVWKYSGSLFIPEYSALVDGGSCVKIKMQSGNRLSKREPAPTDLIILDPCSGFDCSGKGDDALFELPHNKNGYRVYGRILAKPTTNDPTITITPDLSFVEDENGNDLLFLGLVTSDGWETSSASFTRTKGKSKAIDISGLFQWSGDVCHLSLAECLYADPTATCTPRYLCCYDTDSDGIYDVCEDRTDTNGIGGVEETDECPDRDFNSDTVNDDVYPVTAYCRHYENEWIFNIGDLVEYLWDVDNNGSKLLQIRFYPN